MRAHWLVLWGGIEMGKDNHLNCNITVYEGMQPYRLWDRRWGRVVLPPYLLRGVATRDLWSTWKTYWSDFMSPEPSAYPPTSNYMSKRMARKSGCFTNACFSNILTVKLHALTQAIFPSLCEIFSGDVTVPTVGSQKIFGCKDDACRWEIPYSWSYITPSDMMN